MRASAASQTISPANIPASQAKPDAHKADPASPFAILVETAKKDVKDSNGKSADDKPAASRSDVSRNDVKQNDAKQNDVKQNDGKRGASSVQATSQSKPAAPAKAGKPGKDKDATETGKDATEDKQIAAAEQPISDQQTLPPAPVLQASNPVLADAEAQEDIAIDGAAAQPVTQAPNMDAAQADPMDAAANTPPQAQLTAQPDDSDAGGIETAEVVAAQPAAPADTKPVVAAKPAAVKTAAKTESIASTVKSDAANVTEDEPVQTGKNGDEPVHDTQARPAKTEIAKDDNANGVSPKGHVAHDSAASNAKADTAVSDSQRADAPQANPHPAEADSAAAAAKPVPQSASLSNVAFAINNIAAPQAAQHAQAPIATEHVQVTAQAGPNLPALAVEISAKSQSGAKQFDIRLDPPELGRVDVRLSIDATGKASAHLSADQPQTLTLLQKDASILTRALREAGLDVAQDGLNFSLRQQGQGQNNHDGNNGRFAGARTFSLAATASVDPTVTSFAYRGLADGRVDIRV